MRNLLWQMASVPLPLEQWLLVKLARRLGAALGHVTPADILLHSKWVERQNLARGMWGEGLQINLI